MICVAYDHDMLSALPWILHSSFLREELGKAEREDLGPETKWDVKIP